MNPTKSSFFAAAGVTVAALSVVYGSSVRQYLDSGQAFDRASLSDPTPMGLEASNNQIPEDDFYRGLVSLLKRNYVEPITDERKLAIGAVKGMVESLKDPRSIFMNADEFRAFNNSAAGKYEGIGVDLAYDRGKSSANSSELSPADMQDLSIPRLVVVAVTPGGPADRAGVKPGDWVESVESHWVLSPEPVEQYRQAILQVSPTATKGLSPAQVKARQDNLVKVGTALKNKLDSMIMPARAKDMMTIGDNGSLNIVWHRGNTLRPTTINRKDSQVPIVQSEGNTITVRFAEGAAEKLRHAIANKSDVTIDLRNNSNGEFKAMEECLAAVAPSGTYGFIHSDKDRPDRKITVDDGNTKPPKMTILVDESTRGAADIFASALEARHFARLSGTPSNDRSVIEVVSLPDGSGYTLVTGEYQSRESGPRKKVAITAPKPPTPVAMRDYDGTIVSMRETGGNA